MRRGGRKGGETEGLKRAKPCVLKEESISSVVLGNVHICFRSTSMDIMTWCKDETRGKTAGVAQSEQIRTPPFRISTADNFVCHIPFINPYKV